MTVTVAEGVTFEHEAPAATVDLQEIQSQLNGVCVCVCVCGQRERVSDRQHYISVFA